MGKILFVATIFKHLRAFHIPYMEQLKSDGWQVDIMAGGEDVEFDCIDNKYAIDIQRSPFSLKNLAAYRQAKVVIDKEGYDVVYCHTPMGSVISRLASRAMRRKGITKVVYVAHGFHFFKGAPLVNWLCYYPIEKILSRYTDTLVTINSEDFDLAIKHEFNCSSLYKIDGIGIDASMFFVPTPQQKEQLRADNGFDKDDFILLFVAEHNANKNQRFIIDCVPELLLHIPNLKVLFAGQGVLFDDNKQYIEAINIADSVKMLGYRSDIPDLVALADISVSSSRREGLPLNLLEGLNGGNPIIAVKNRGHNEIVQDGVNGFLVEQNDSVDFIDKVKLLYDDKNLFSQLCNNSVASVERFNLEYPLQDIMNIFRDIFTT